MQDAKRRAIIFVVVALLLSTIAGYLFMKEVSAVNGSLGKTTTIYVASKDVPSREPLKPEYFKPVEVPTKFVQDSSVTDLNQIRLGKYQFQVNQLISVVPISKDGILTTNMLKEQSFLTSNDKRMVSIAKSDRIVFDGNFDFNDRVDIIVSSRGDNSPTTKTFMRDVLVVGVSKGESGDVNGLGLEMTLAQAEDFIHRQNFAVAIRILKAPSEKKENKKTNRPQDLPDRSKSPQGSEPGRNEEPPATDPSQAKPEDEIVDPSGP